jgi:two-component system, NtrC family, nitrogen regulation response regulator GlnG
VGTLDIDTLDFAQSQSVERQESGIGLTILAHPDLSRVGEVAVLSPTLRGGCVNLSRTEPLFAGRRSPKPRPLLHPVISRQPIAISALPTAIRVDAGELGQRVRLSAAAQPDSNGYFPRSELERGIAIELSGCVLLLLHDMSSKPSASTPDSDSDSDSEFVGDSAAIANLRAEIARVAESNTGVLIRGETGTGKELVARAIHRLSKRSAAPFVAVNMAAVPESTAASALFGHERGAFTSALREHRGYFGAASGGTLFLDEIGETTKSVQGLLLRALREGEIQPVGAADVKKVDVRVLAATDAPLEEWVRRERFSEALLHRLEAYTIPLPPLRQRRDDIARLFVSFLEKELAELGETRRFSATLVDARPWLPASFMASLIDYRWPGNVAELQSIARRVAIANRGVETFRVDDWVGQRLVARASEGHRAAGETAVAKPPKREAAQLIDAEIVGAMRQCRFIVREAAEHLGVSRSWLHTRLEFCRALRQAKDLTSDEIRAALERAKGSTSRAAVALEVSEHGLKLRMKALNVACDA